MRTRIIYPAAALLALLAAAAVTGCATTGGPGQAVGPATEPANAASATGEPAADAPESGVLIHEGKKNAVLFGGGFVFTVKAPEGWMLDESGDLPYPNAVFYPAGGSWSTSAAVMYAHAEVKDAGLQDVERAISNDVASFEENNPGLLVTAADSLETWNKAEEVPVRYFFYINYDAVAYIEEEKAIVYIVLTATNGESFEASIPAFERLVGSYYYMGDKLTITE